MYGVRFDDWDVLVVKGEMNADEVKAVIGLQLIG
jgi:hypothetical protein